MNLTRFRSPSLHEICEQHLVTCQVSCQNVQTISPFPPVSASTEGSHVVIMKGPWPGMWWLENCLKRNVCYVIEIKLLQQAIQ